MSSSNEFSRKVYNLSAISQAFLLIRSVVQTARHLNEFSSALFKMAVHDGIDEL